MSEYISEYKKMIKNIAIISLFILTTHADIISFYKDALKTLQYDKSYTLYEHSNTMSQDAFSSTKFANFK